LELLAKALIVGEIWQETEYQAYQNTLRAEAVQELERPSRIAQEDLEKPPHFAVRLNRYVKQIVGEARYGGETLFPKHDPLELINPKATSS
jgi:hypothetical protein